MVARNCGKSQSLPPVRTALALPPHCPRCGTNLLRILGPWSPEPGALLEWLVQLEEDVHALRGAVEREVQP